MNVFFCEFYQPVHIDRRDISSQYFHGWYRFFFDSVTIVHNTVSHYDSLPYLFLCEGLQRIHTLVVQPNIGGISILIIIPLDDRIALGQIDKLAIQAIELLSLDLVVSVLLPVYFSIPLCPERQVPLRVEKAPDGYVALGFVVVGTNGITGSGQDHRSTVRTVVSLPHDLISCVVRVALFVITPGVDDRQAVRPEISLDDDVFGVIVG